MEGKLEDEVEVEIEEEEVVGKTNRIRGGGNPKVVSRKKKRVLSWRSAPVDVSRRVDSPPKWDSGREARSERGIDDKKPSHSTTADVSTKDSNASE